MIETAMVFDLHGDVLHWHEPPGRSGSYIPDSKDLWDVLWKNRRLLGGVAHVHPWRGSAWPSDMDTSTFKAVEDGLGRRLLWPIVTFTELSYWGWVGDVTRSAEWAKFHTSALFAQCKHWDQNIKELRRRSGQGEKHDGQ